MGVTKVTIVDSPEKMRTQSAGYSIIIPQIKERTPHSEQTNTQKKSSITQLGEMAKMSQSKHI